MLDRTTNLFSTDDVADPRHEAAPVGVPSGDADERDVPDARRESDGIARGPRSEPAGAAGESPFAAGLHGGRSPRISRGARVGGRARRRLNLAMAAGSLVAAVIAVAAVFHSPGPGRTDVDERGRALRRPPGRSLERPVAAVATGRTWPPDDRAARRGRRSQSHNADGRRTRRSAAPPRARRPAAPSIRRSRRRARRHAAAVASPRRPAVVARGVVPASTAPAVPPPPEARSPGAGAPARPPATRAPRRRAPAPPAPPDPATGGGGEFGFEG
jgi:hypothetical protein